MTPQQLADDITAEREAEYGDQYGFPERYFNCHIFVSQPGGSTDRRQVPREDSLRRDSVWQHAEEAVVLFAIPAGIDRKELIATGPWCGYPQT